MNSDSFQLNLLPKNEQNTCDIFNNLNDNVHYLKENVIRISQESNEEVSDNLLLTFNDLIEPKNDSPTTDNYLFRDDFKTSKKIDELKKMFFEASLIEEDKKRIECFLNIWDENSTLGYMNKIHSLNCSPSDNEEFKMSLVSELALIVDFVNDGMKSVNDENVNNKTENCDLLIDNSTSFNDQDYLNLLQPSMSNLKKFDSALPDQQSIGINEFINENELIDDEQSESVNNNLQYVDANFRKNIENYNEIADEQANIETKPENLSMPYSKRYKNKLKLSCNINDNPILIEFPTKMNHSSYFFGSNENCDNINDEFNYNSQNTEILEEWIASVEHINYDNNEYNKCQIIQDNNTKTEMNLKTYGNDLYDFDGYLINIPKSTSGGTSNEYSTINSATNSLSTINCASIYNDIDIKFKLENRTLIPDNGKIFSWKKIFIDVFFIARCETITKTLHILPGQSLCPC